MEKLLYIAPIAGVLALVFAFIKASWIKKQDAGDAKMKDIADQIQTGAMAFLRAEYRVLSVFVVAVALLLFAANMNKTIAGIEEGTVAGWVPAVTIVVAFVLGAVASAVAGWAGMKVATDANVRTTAAARSGLPEALNVAFSGGSVMGMTVVGLAVIGLAGLYIAYSTGFVEGVLGVRLAVNALAGFSMGASSIALFARVGGGIYTKAADVGADLVGKVEAGLPEDDPRNPAVIADNVGDNVGDVAGMGADLFESFVGAIVGAMVLGLGFVLVNEADGNLLSPVVMPLVIAGAGIVCSILGTFVVRTKEGGNPQHALDAGAFGASGVMAVATFGIAKFMWPEGGVKLASEAGNTINPKIVEWTDVGVATVVGLGTGVLVGLITSYYCSMDKKPVDSIANQSKTGTATNIIAGLGVGMQSTALPILVIAVGVVLANYFAGLYGVAIAALGMLSTTGIQLAVDAYGPIADNAGGIAEMSEQDPAVRERTDKLDAVGNTTAAIGKGFAIGSAAMTALALFAAFMQQAHISVIDISNPLVMAGLFIGGMLPFLFSSMAMNAVGAAAMEMIEEVRRQFREIDGLLEGNAKPDTARCVEISTQASIKRMVVPGLLAVVTPVVIGFIFGPSALGGLLAGVTVSGVLMAIFMSNAGGAWDNAKKSFEGEGFKMEDGSVHPKGSEAHKASVVGDTVGDPFKDTAGPSLNILVKLMSVVSLVIAPLIAIPVSANTDIDADLDPLAELGDAATGLADGVKKGVEEVGEKVAEAGNAMGKLGKNFWAKLFGYDLRLNKAEIDGKPGIELLGAVPSEDIRVSLVKKANDKFANVNAEGLTVDESIGFPEGIDESFGTALDALTKFQLGHIDFSGSEVSVSGALADSDREDVNKLLASWPEGFSSEISLTDSAAAKACEEKLSEATSTQIKFETGSSDISVGQEEVLTKVKEAVKACPEEIMIVVEGHTDSTGSAETNQKLSQERAQSVADSLVADGVSKEKLIVVGYGSSRPVSGNNTGEGKAANRRIEIHLNL